MLEPTMFGGHKEKPSSWPLTERTSPPVDNTQPPPDQNPSCDPKEVVQLGNGAITNYSPPETGHRAKGELPTWLKANMLAASITVYIMFAVGPVLCAFGLMMRDDLEGE
jgi:hypothetical protein